MVKFGNWRFHQENASFYTYWLIMRVSSLNTIDLMDQRREIRQRVTSRDSLDDQASYKRLSKDIKKSARKNKKEHCGNVLVK